MKEGDVVQILHVDNSDNESKRYLYSIGEIEKVIDYIVSFPFDVKIYDSVIGRVTTALFCESELNKIGRL